jgi:hypothetical protein
MRDRPFSSIRQEKKKKKKTRKENLPVERKDKQNSFIGCLIFLSTNE